MPSADVAARNGSRYEGQGTWHNNNGGYRNSVQPAWADAEPEAEDGDYDDDTTTGGAILRQPSRNGQFDIRCTRTILLSGLAEGTTHVDITDAIRGGLLLDVFLRSHDRSVAVSFLHAADARGFFDHVRKNDLYIKNKRVSAAA